MKRAHGKDDGSAPASKKAKSTITTISKPEQETDDNGDPYWAISAKRRITIQTFKGTTLVGLREYYEKDGKTLPGRQGISLTVEQFTSLVLAVPDIKRALAGAGVEVEVDEGWEAEEGGEGGRQVERSVKPQRKTGDESKKGEKKVRKEVKKPDRKVERKKFVVSSDDEEEEEEEEEEDDEEEASEEEDD